MKQQFIAAIIALIFLGLLAHRVWRSAQLDPRGHSAMPIAFAGSDEEYRQLYLTPGGAYTRADIEANGNTTPRQTFRGFQARHDFAPRPGDRLCPITRTKADSRCAWIIGGRTYQFCCPPCIDEFVRLAKQDPSQIQAPQDYILAAPPEQDPK